MTELHGECMCGAVTVTATPARAALGACHCDMCRRWTSSAYVSFPVEPGYAALGPVEVYRSSDWAERGFCKECGASLFFRPLGKGIIEVAPGSIDGPTGTMLAGHNFVGLKGDYYELADGLPQRQD